MARTPNITPTLISRLKKKASVGQFKFRIAAFAFSKKGNFLGSEVNSSLSRIMTYEEYARRCVSNETCKFTGKHAERALMEKYGKKIATILVVRIGHSGELRPIDPCEMCKKIATKLGIKIISIEPEL